MQIQTEQLLEQIDNFAGICRPGFLTPGSDGMFHCEVLVKESCGSSNWYNVVRTCKNNKWLLEENETLHYWIHPAPETKAALLSLLQQKKEEEMSDQEAAKQHTKEYVFYEDAQKVFLAGCAHVRSQLSAKDINFYVATEHRQLHDLTELEVLELLELAGESLAGDVAKQTEDDIDFIQNQGYWSNSALLGKEYIIFKTESEFPHEQELYIPMPWEVRGMEDTSCGVDPYHITIGKVSGIYAHLNPVEVIEWFLKKGFKVGNFSLSDYQQSAKDKEKDELLREMGGVLKDLSTRYSLSPHIVAICKKPLANFNSLTSPSTITEIKSYINE